MCVEESLRLGEDTMDAEGGDNPAVDEHDGEKAKAIGSRVLAQGHCLRLKEVGLRMVYNAGRQDLYEE